MATYQFLSDEWLAEARTIRAEFEGKGASIEHSIRMNLVIAEVPFGEGTVEAHVDTSTGELVLDTGHIDPVDLKVSLDYDVAKAILVEGNPQAGIQAFMSGQDQGRGGHRQADGPPVDHPRSGGGGDRSPGSWP